MMNEITDQGICNCILISNNETIKKCNNSSKMFMDITFFRNY